MCYHNSPCCARRAMACTLVPPQRSHTPIQPHPLLIVSFRRRHLKQNCAVTFHANLDRKKTPYHVTRYSVTVRGVVSARHKLLLCGEPIAPKNVSLHQGAACHFVFLGSQLGVVIVNVMHLFVRSSTLTGATASVRPSKNLSVRRPIQKIMR